jgi:hypothetical protein
MPFTFCHPAIILPFSKYKKLSTSALIIGSTAPDFEYFIRMDLIRTHSHDFWAMFYFNLPLTIILYIIFQKIVKTPLINHLPTPLFQRFQPYKQEQINLPSLKNIFLITTSALIGIFSHLLWDSFTHQSGFFENHFSFQLHHFHLLGNEYVVFRFLQFWSSIFGGIYIIYFVYKLPKTNKKQTNNPMHFWTISIIIALLVIYIRDCDTVTKLIATSISSGMIGIIVTAFFTRIKVQLL